MRHLCKKARALRHVKRLQSGVDYGSSKCQVVDGTLYPQRIPYYVLIL